MLNAVYVFYLIGDRKKLFITSWEYTMFFCSSQHTYQVRIIIKTTKLLHVVWVITNSKRVSICIYVKLARKLLNVDSSIQLWDIEIMKVAVVFHSKP